MIGKRLALARRATGLSLRDLAAAIDNKVTAQAIGKYERDEMMPNSAVLNAMAEAMHVTPDFLLNPPDIELVEAEFRAEMTTERQLATLQATVIAEVERYLELEDILAEQHRWQQPEGFPYPANKKEDAELAATRLRQLWNLGSDPIPNLVEFLEERGIKVVCLSLPEAISGMMCWVKRKDGAKIPVIALNKDHDGERQRFSLAHELGHLVLIIPEVLGEKDKENLCHRFAGAFLIPLDTLVAKIGRVRRTVPIEEFLALKPVFRVSAQAIMYRCHEMSIINRSALSDLYKTIHRNGWRKKEPMQVEPDKPARFGRLCFRALAEECITESKAAELLQVPVRNLYGHLHKITGLQLQ